ncbi:MAG: aminotransferase class I/II-fold pyridoxal phosphate-dependent enzyme [Ruminococcaceae bacterium]|nr:aminotransferase class I/II-fold pyridoxal phosphate-dependent enzyme [Oscillospiraceae bacterium]
MKEIFSAKLMDNIHSDIRGPLFIEAMEMQKQGADILKLNTGNPAAFGFKMPQSIISALRGNEERGLGYCDFMGMPDAREAICNYHTKKGIIGIHADDLFVGNGVSEVVSFALTALLNPGDEVLLPSPCYSLWSNSTHLCSAKPVFYVCDEKADWNPDCNDIRKKITDKTRAIVIINPNNPTGMLYSDEVLKEIANIAREKGLMIFSDEIYDRLILDGLKHTSIAALAPDLPIVTMNGLSKSHSLCGLRVGWMVISGPRHLTEDYRQAIIKLTSLRLCSNALAQIVIPAALEDGETPASMVRPGGRIFEQREATAKGLSDIDGLSFVKNNSAFYIFAKLDAKKFNITDDRKFARDLLHGTNILIVPGSGFEFDTPDHFRIVMLPEADVLKSATSKIGKFLSTYIQK